MNSSNDKSTATIIHLSTLSQYFIPLGNFIFPIILWSAMRDRSPYINEQGKQAINFQLSLFLYCLIIGLVTVPFIIIGVLRGLEWDYVSNFNMHYHLDFKAYGSTIIAAIVAAIVFGALKVAEFILVIYAALKTSQGENFKFPLTINFLK
jgi:uncharacterized Tic20 family protein